MGLNVFCAKAVKSIPQSIIVANIFFMGLADVGLVGVNFLHVIAIVNYRVAARIG